MSRRGRGVSTSRNVAGAMRRCEAKDRYEDKSDAMKNGVERVLSKYGKQMYPYHCKLCGGWHISERIR